MRAVVLAAVLAAGCVPSRRATFAPVAHAIEQRVGLAATWEDRADPRVPPAVRARLREPLDAEGAVRIALATNRRLQAQFDALGIAASQIADATVLPPLAVDLEAKRGGELEVDAVQDVLDLVQLPQRRRVAQAELAAARARAVVATVVLVARVEQAYVDVVAAQETVALRQTALDAASAAAEVAARQLAAGTTTDLALLRERNQRELMRVELVRAQVTAAARREALTALLGLAGEDARWTVAARLPALPDAPPALATLERDAVERSLERDAIRAEGAAAAGRLGIARLRSWLPAVGVGVAADRRAGDWELGPVLSLGIPLFDPQAGARARARAERRRADNELAATTTELAAQARAVRQRVEGTYREARHLRDVVLPQRQQLVDETLRHYNAMNASTFELLAARRDLVDTGRQYLDALRRFWRAHAEARALARGAMPPITEEES